MPRRRIPRPARGFTLMEAVFVIVLTGIVAVMVVTFIRQPVNAYVDLARRTELTDAADISLRRMARDLQTALPNSVRVDAAGHYLEFLPVRSAGRYRHAPTASGGGDALDFSSADDRFEVLGPPVTALAGDQLVLHNLGMPGADAYEGSSRRALTSTGTALSSLSFAIGAGQFPFASPNHRFHIVSTPVTYACSPLAGGAGELRRLGGYAIQATQPTASAAAPLSALTGAHNALLTEWVSDCRFSYSTSAATRHAVVTLHLTLTSGGESITLLQQVQVEGSP